jgi:hypothetical protein
MVTQTCNPSDSGEPHFEASLGKKVQETPFSTNDWVWWCTSVSYCYMGKHKQEDENSG